MRGLDDIAIEILEDGTIKVTTNPVSGPNHASAEAFLREMSKLAGGETTRTRRSDAHTHQHGHIHSHDGGHTHHEH